MGAAGGVTARALKSNERARRIFPANPFPRSLTPLPTRYTNRKSRPRKSDREFGPRHETRIAQASHLPHAPFYSNAKVSSDRGGDNRRRTDCPRTQRPQNSSDRTARHSKSY